MPSLVVTMWRRFLPRTYVKLRAIGRFLRTWLFASTGRFSSVLYRMWPVTFAWIVLLLCFLLPGLANSQAFEAMFEYARSGAQIGIVWLRLLTSAVLVFALGAIMAASAGDLLDSEPATNARSPRALLVIAALCRWLPTLAMAVAFYQMQATVDGKFYPYGAMALALILLRVGFSIVLQFALKSEQIRAICLIVARHGSAFVIGGVALAILFFGSPGRDRWMGIPLSSTAVAQALGPVNILILFLTAFIALTTMLVRLGRRLHLPLVWLLVVAALIVSRYDLNDNHMVRRTGAPTSKAPTVEEAFDDWMNSRPDKDSFSEYPVILVSAEGGGIRAAFFTAMALARIADRCPRMVNHIFAISGVSGGAIGAALFASAIKAWPVDATAQRCDLAQPVPPIYENALAEVLQDDHLSPLLARMLFSDAVQQIIPYPIDSFDRQRGLEYSIERAFRRVFSEDLMSMSIYNLRPDVTNPAVPYLFLNTTEVQSGRRFVLTPLFLQSQPFGGAQDWHWLDWDYGPPLSAAAGVSARFPVFSPAGYFFNNGRKARYVDGGYVDNSGTVTLSEIFHALYLLREEKYLDDYKAGKTTKFAMTSLHIGNAPACDIIRDELAIRQANGKELPRCDLNDAAPVAGGFSELLSPLEAVIGVRSAQVEYNLYQFFNRIDLGTDLNRFDYHSRVQMYDRGISVPLGWLLSSRVAAELRSQLDARPGEPECESQTKSSNLCELQSTVAGATWEN
ncbi:patatin-like phospholipase family protein [Rhizobium leguminosarum]|uniref:patatin-like phospholipase family protein n=1 Tax=Rhizobium leguminosarum TaxID=384 RepID=UPI001C96547D|nr:patatin-like phospholipase family protein [Rhizobium leguminosarum]MBY5645535.1 patatin-like phospholipase family protein [Rhizobium leguminosarum]